MRFSWIGVAAAVVIGSASCRSEPRADLPEVGDVLPLLPLPPDATGVTRSGSEDALQLTIQTSRDVDEMVGYYRHVFSEEPWVLISDTKAPDGANVLYAEADRRPIWVRIERSTGASGSTVQLSGAIVAEVDTTAADTTGP